MKNNKWNEADRFAFATQKLRATRVPDKKKEQARRACRKRVSW